MAVLSVLQLLAIASAGIALRIAHRYFSKSPLDNLPGPPPGSVLVGESYMYKYLKYSISDLDLDL